MQVCTFFGHRDCPNSVVPQLREVLTNLIENRGADTFYVGNNGAFDSIVRGVLRELSQKYAHIRYFVVLAYPPQKKDSFDSRDFSDTILPEGLESVPKRFAISWRNDWMLRRADFVVTYVTHSWGGAAQFAGKAKRQGKFIIDLSKCV